MAQSGAHAKTWLWVFLAGDVGLLGHGVSRLGSNNRCSSPCPNERPLSSPASGRSSVGCFPVAQVLLHFSNLAALTRTVKDKEKAIKR